MQKLEVFGANKLRGQIKISGSKNASLPILAATLLSNKKISLKIFQKFEILKQCLHYFNHWVLKLNLRKIKL